MGKKFTMTVEVQIDEEELSCLISTAMSDTCGFDWWGYDEGEYKKAEDELKAEGANPCHEDIMARILVNGGKLRLLESESDWHWSGHEPGESLWSWQIRQEGCVPEGGTWHEVGLKDIIKGIALYGESGCCNECGADIHRINEDGDFWDADAVFQFAAYGELVFG